MARAMSLAIRESGVDLDEIDQIDVSANFSGELDRMEYDWLKNIFRETKDGLSVTPLKYLMGDFGGAGAVRAAAILLSLNYQLPLPTVRAELLSGGPQQALEWYLHPTCNVRSTLMTTTTFGGGSACLIFTKNLELELL